MPHRRRPTADAAIADALDACAKAQARGGNQVAQSDKADNDSRVKGYDEVWVKHIKAALMENRFRLVQQPIASLHGADHTMCDVLLRMLDTNGKEVLPGEFMPAAERNDMLKNIDRWVVGASLSFAAQRKPGCLFVRLSQDTLEGCLLSGLARQPGARHPLGPAPLVFPGSRGCRGHATSTGCRSSAPSCAAADSASRWNASVPGAIRRG